MMVSYLKTNLETQITKIINLIKSSNKYNINVLGAEILNILFGFFCSTALSTIPAQTGDWGIVASAIIVTNQEIISKITYQKYLSKHHYNNIILQRYLKYFNSIKLGILYGLFIDAFKLGS